MHVDFSFDSFFLGERGKSTNNEHFRLRKHLTMIQYDKIPQDRIISNAFLDLFDFTNTSINLRTLVSFLPSWQYCNRLKH